MIYNVGQTVRIGPSDTNPDGLELRGANGVLVTATSNNLVVIKPDGTAVEPTTHTDTQGVYYADVDTDQPGVWSWRWLFHVGSQSSVADGQFAVDAAPTSAPTFATIADVQRRLGGGDLTDAQQDQIGLLLEMATSAIAAVCDRDEAWAADLPRPVPGALRIVAMEAAIRAYVNPDGARTIQEQLGQYGSTRTYAASQPAGIGLTDVEVRMVRRAVFGAGIRSVRIGAIVDELAPTCATLPDTTAS